MNTTPLSNFVSFWQIISLTSELLKSERVLQVIQELSKSSFHHLIKEISMVAGNSHSEGRLGRVPTENGLVAPTPRFKQREVSVVRDFLSGCGSVAAPITRPSEQATIN
ncbi:hypothetical protein J1N35_041443 [Gossypium stocksii]|uniref:Uncharacterized protein n=1 Tax=Gossypium stocksii TaxID=47602 RepID=A0A9D3ZIN5_9ROSI|nr:hypothetical protein J1N35_041443 [Gossypium stocksii]